MKNLTASNPIVDVHASPAKHTVDQNVRIPVSPVSDQTGRLDALGNLMLVLPLLFVVVGSVFVAMSGSAPVT